MTASGVLRFKRIYDEAETTDGYRVLVDRLWPRGVAKDDGAFDVWLKEVAPSTELRAWFGHQPERYDEFARRYRTELDDNPALGQLRDVMARHPAVTLLYGAKDEVHNQAVVLAEYLGESAD